MIVSIQVIVFCVYVLMCLDTPTRPPFLSTPMVKPNKSHESSLSCFDFRPAVVFLNNLALKGRSAFLTAQYTAAN